KGTDGNIPFADPFLWRRVLMVTLTACLIGGIAGLAALLLHWPNSLPVWNISRSLTLSLACATIGALAALLWLRRSKHGIDPGVLRDHARWLVSGESVLILQAPVESLQRPVAMVRASSDIPPALFIMHPKA